MKNWVRLMKLIQMPTSIGMMWISSSSRTAGRTSRYVVAPFQRGRRRLARAAAVTGALVGAALGDVVVVMGIGLSLPRWRTRPAARGSRPGAGSVVGSGSCAHLVLGLLHRLRDVGGGDVLAGGCLGEQAVHGVADIGLERGLGGDERERLGLRG